VLVGAAVFLGLMWWAAKTRASQWQAVSNAYAARPPASPIARKTPETIIVAQRGATGPLSPGGFRNYAGVSIAVHDDGLALSLVPPFNILCPPIFLPYDGMAVVPTSWGLWPEPVAIRMRHAPDVDIIVARDTVRWLREHSRNGPFGNKPA